MRGHALIPILLLLALAVPARAQDSPRAWVAAGIEAYTLALETGERDQRLAGFRRAEHLFQQALARDARSPDLYVNLGNAALQAERLGSSVLAYRRALRLDPGHARARHNLDSARSLLPSWVPRADSRGVLERLFFWHRTLPGGQGARVAAACFALSALLLAVAIRTGGAAWRAVALFPALAWLAFMTSLVLDPADREHSAAVVTVEETLGRAADSDLAPRSFPEPLPGGVEMKIVEERPPWLRVRLADGRETWVAASALTRVVPSR